MRKPTLPAAIRTPASSAAERMRRMRARRKAEGFRPVVRWESADAESMPAATFSDHRLHEARSLAMHCVIAQRLINTPAIVDRARATLARWTASQEGAPPRWLAEWQRILTLPATQIAGVISEPSERGARLRQSSPFAGVLSAAERKRIFSAFVP